MLHHRLQESFQHPHGELFPDRKRAHSAEAKTKMVRSQGIMWVFKYFLLYVAFISLHMLGDFNN